MKVLYVQDLFPPETFGGGEVYSENILTELKKKGIKFEVVAGTKYKTRTGKYKGIIVHRINWKPSRYLFNVKAIKKMEEVVEKFKPDIIHGNAMQSAIPVSLVGDKYEIPTVVNVHFYFQKYYKEYFDPVRAKIFAKVEKYVMNHSYEKIISLDKYVYDNLKKNKIKSVLIEHMINTKNLKPKKKPNKFTISTILTMGASKRNDIFINLAKKYEDKFNFIACGNYDKKIEIKLKNAGIQTYGYIQNQKLGNFLNKSHIYIGHGMAARDAMSCGVVAILNEDTERLRKYHTKELKAKIMLNGNHDKIINKLFDNKKTLQSLSKKSAQFIIKNYSSKIIIPKILKVYKELVK